MIPKRIQRKRTKGYRQPDNCRYVGRGTRWGNPYKIGDLLGYVRHKTVWAAGYANLPANTIITPEMAVNLYRVWMENNIKAWPGTFGHDFLTPLRQYEYLSCFCPLSEVCHVDILIEELSK